MRDVTKRWYTRRSCSRSRGFVRRGEVTPLTRLEVEAMLPRRGLGSNARLKKPAADVSADALDDLASARAADVLLLVEIPDCEWCAATRPAFRQLAKSRASTDPRATRVCAFEAKTPEDRQWAHKHLAAHSFPTVIALRTRAVKARSFRGGLASLQPLLRPTPAEPSLEVVPLRRRRAGEDGGPGGGRRQRGGGSREREEARGGGGRGRPIDDARVRVRVRVRGDGRTCTLPFAV